MRARIYDSATAHSLRSLPPQLNIWRALSFAGGAWYGRLVPARHYLNGPLPQGCARRHHRQPPPGSIREPLNRRRCGAWPDCARARKTGDRKFALLVAGLAVLALCGLHWGRRWRRRFHFSDALLDTMLRKVTPPASGLGGVSSTLTKRAQYDSAFGLHASHVSVPVASSERCLCHIARCAGLMQSALCRPADAAAADAVAATVLTFDAASGVWTLLG
jgi:hypothetical protein